MRDVMKQSQIAARGFISKDSVEVAVQDDPFGLRVAGVGAKAANPLPHRRGDVLSVAVSIIFRVLLNCDT